jgi:hypothetical protein
MYKSAFYTIAKHIKSIHIKNQVTPIGMNKSAGQKTPPLFIVGNGWRVKNEIVINFIIRKCGYRRQNGDNNNDQGYCHRYLLMVKNNKKGGMPNTLRN